jgi:hypothetical protein
MTDRFDAQLRQHLLENANERATEGQLAAIAEQVARTSQRGALPARLTWWPGRIGPLPSAAVRFGLVAAALLVALVAALIVGSSAPNPRTVFEGRWTAIDQPDGSTLNLTVSPGETPTIRFEDLFAAGEVCVSDEVKVFTAEGTGVIDGTHLEATFPDGGGCGLAVADIALAYDYDPVTDTMRDQDGIVWLRVQGGAGQSQPPSRGTYFEGIWTVIDQADGSTMNLQVGPGTRPNVRFEDLFATGPACVEDEVKVFTAIGVGEISGTSFTVAFPNGGGCGSMVVDFALAFRYDPDTDTISGDDGVPWHLVRGAEAVPTAVPPTGAVATDALPTAAPATEAPATEAPATEALPSDPIATDAAPASAPSDAAPAEAASTDAPATDPHLPAGTPEAAPAR